MSNRSKIIRFGEYKDKSNMICDVNGDFYLSSANNRAVRLLFYIKNKRILK